jgi:hypothetical protein
MEPTPRIKTYYEPQVASYVYFIRALGGLGVKIGVTTNVTKRLKALRIASPNRLELLGYILGDVEMERVLHIRFDEHRLRGEWFAEHVIPDVIELLQRDGVFMSEAA